MSNEHERTVWIVSEEPATSDLSTDRSSMASISFREHVPVHMLRKLVKEFASDLSEIFQEMESVKKSFHVESIEINAVMAADGKLGILGSSVGTKAEGGIKFVLKRLPQRP
jgi:hypothetical protein